MIFTHSHTQKIRRPSVLTPEKYPASLSQLRTLRRLYNYGICHSTLSPERVLPAMSAPRQGSTLNGGSGTLPLLLSVLPLRSGPPLPQGCTRQRAAARGVIVRRARTCIVVAVAPSTPSSGKPRVRAFHQCASRHCCAGSTPRRLTSSFFYVVQSQEAASADFIQMFERASTPMGE